MTRDEFFRQVYAVDTRAGDKLQYMFTKAEACPDYAREIHYAPIIPYRGIASRVVLGSFLWINTPEGRLYWKSVFNMLVKKGAYDG